eukprot:COSAG01_NODE_11774_length_1861_cov_5.780931_1_plen_69_part_00
MAMLKSSPDSSSAGRLRADAGIFPAMTAGAVVVLATTGRGVVVGILTRRSAAVKETKIAVKPPITLLT